MKIINGEDDQRRIIKKCEDLGLKTEKKDCLTFHDINDSKVKIDINNNVEEFKLEGIMLTPDTRIYTRYAEIIRCGIDTSSETIRTVEMVKMVGYGYAILNRYYINKNDMILILFDKPSDHDTIIIHNVYVLEDIRHDMKDIERDVMEDVMEYIFGNRDTEEKWKEP